MVASTTSAFTVSMQVCRLIFAGIWQLRDLPDGTEVKFQIVE